jgi:hypothetical protein
MMTIFCCDLEHFVNIETKVSVPPAPRKAHALPLRFLDAIDGA